MILKKNSEIMNEVVKLFVARPILLETSTNSEEIYKELSILKVFYLKFDK
jgi:hypothetical protein